MKIGIVTQPLWGNYGGLLQNFALQTTLRRLGHDPITIDYVLNLKWSEFLFFTIKSILLYPFHSHRRNFPMKYPVREDNSINRFIEKYISKTDYVYKYKTSLIDKLGFDVLITGSDQVWRPKYNRGHLANMYLDFAIKRATRRIAYAASFGSSEKEYTIKNIKQCIEAAKSLDAISVRESSGIKLCKDYFGINAVKVLDPTLLLSANDYRDLTVDIPPIDEKYIGTYILDHHPCKNNILQSICQSTGLSKIRGFTESDLNATPKEWIANIRDAQFIVTDSFHGTIFSIIFQKPFITFCNQQRGADRFISLLKPLGLSNRIIDDKTSNIELTVLQHIDWEKVYSILSEQRTASLKFLAMSIS